MKSQKKPSTSAPAPSARSSGPERAAPPSHEEITERARRIWQERGQPEGKDLEHWLEAERQLGVPPGRRDSVGLTDRDIESDKSVDGLVQRPR
jgi:hypothetical protein